MSLLWLCPHDGASTQALEFRLTPKFQDHGRQDAGKRLLREFPLLALGFDPGNLRKGHSEKQLST